MLITISLNLHLVLYIYQLMEFFNVIYIICMCAYVFICLYDDNNNNAYL